MRCSESENQDLDAVFLVGGDVMFKVKTRLGWYVGTDEALGRDEFSRNEAKAKLLDAAEARRMTDRLELFGAEIVG